MQYTALVTADLHLNDNSRDSYRHDFMRSQLPKLLKQYKPKYLIILGDLTDEKDRHRSELVNAVVNYLHTYSNICKVIILRGNHDCLDPTSPFFQFVSLLENVLWINKPTPLKLGELGECLFLPHTRNYERDWKHSMFALYTTDPLAGYIFCHNAFEGAVSESGKRMQGIPTSIFPKKATVLSGDIHVPQQVGPVTYCGAPYTIRFGDKFTPCIRMLRRSQNRLCIDTQPTSGPQKRIIEVKNTARLDRYVEKFNEGDLLKLRVHLKADEYPKWNEIKEQLRDWCDQNGGIVCEIQPVKQSASIKLNRKSVSTRTDHELLETYAKRKGISASILRTGLKIMEEV